MERSEASRKKAAAERADESVVFSLGVLRFFLRTYHGDFRASERALVLDSREVEKRKRKKTAWLD